MEVVAQPRPVCAEGDDPPWLLSLLGWRSACPHSQLGSSAWLLAPVGSGGKGEVWDAPEKKLHAGSVGECSGGGTDYSTLKNCGHGEDKLLDPVQLAARLVHPPAVQS